jgi:hypothetical protein
MNQTDARNFILALNNIAGYVPPMLMGMLTSNPLCRLIEQVANPPMTGEQQGEQQGEQTNNATPERPKPHIVS